MERSLDAAASGHDHEQFFVSLYRRLLVPRLVEERMLLLLRQGRISKWFSGIGQEAIAVGATSALDRDDTVFPLMRNLGVFTTRGVPLARLFAQFQGCRDGFTKGRDRSFHFGSLEHGIVGMISHLGPQLSVADGAALGHLMDGSGKICLAFTGDGGTSQGEFHEALNLAAVWALPVIFIIEQNGWALSTPIAEQYRCSSLADRGAGYGIPSETLDGNDVLAVYAAVAHHAREIRRRPGPVLLECKTYRMRGHEEASGIAYVPADELAAWKAHDPIARFEATLRGKGYIDDGAMAAIRDELTAEIAAAVEEGFACPAAQSTDEAELGDVYAASPAAPADEPEAAASWRPMRFVDAVSDGLRTAMEEHSDLVLMGQDIAEYGGVFKVTEGFVESFGKDRVRNTPLCESAVIGAGLGLSVTGRRSVIEMQFADFVSCGFNQIVNNLAKVHYRWGQNASVTIRLPTGAGVRAGPFHSQSTEAWFFHVPGLKIVYPSSPADAKLLLLAAIDDPNPVLFFEHKALYRSVEGPVPPGAERGAIGRARTVRQGHDLTIITYGAGVHWALAAAGRLTECSIEILDLRSLLPWDRDAVELAVEKTGRVMLLHEDTLTGGIGAEISAWIAEHCFASLDAPIARAAALDTPVPFAAALEDRFLPLCRIDETIKRLLRY